MFDEQINRILDAAADFKELYVKAENAALPAKLEFLSRMQLLADYDYDDDGESGRPSLNS